MDLLRMSIQGGIMIAAIAVFRAVFINRLPKTFFILLWEAAIIRLLIPFRLPEAAKEAAAKQSAVFGTDISGNMGTFAQIPAVLGEGTGAYPAAEGIKPDIAAAIWLIGALIMVAYFAATYIRCRLEFRFSLPLKSDFASEWLKSRKLKRTVTVRLSGAVSSPMTYGLIRPVILLPKGFDAGDTEKLRLVLLHEFNHIRRADGVLKFFSNTALCIHWFNPLVWAMHSLIARDIELRCDEDVLRELGIDSRKDYALALIELEEKRSGLSPIGPGFARTAIEERIGAIMKYRNTTILSVVAAAVIAAAVGITVFTAAGTDGRQTANLHEFEEAKLSGYKTEITPPNDAVTLELDEAKKGFTIPAGGTVVLTNGGEDFVLEEGKILSLRLSRLLPEGYDLSLPPNQELYAGLIEDGKWYPQCFTYGGSTYGEDDLDEYTVWVETYGDLTMEAKYSEAGDMYANGKVTEIPVSLSCKEVDGDKSKSFEPGSYQIFLTNPNSDELIICGVDFKITEQSGEMTPEETSKRAEVYGNIDVGANYIISDMTTVGPDGVYVHLSNDPTPNRSYRVTVSSADGETLRTQTTISNCVLIQGLKEGEYIITAATSLDDSSWVDCPALDFGTLEVSKGVNVTVSAETASELNGVIISAPMIYIDIVEGGDLKADHFTAGTSLTVFNVSGEGVYFEKGEKATVTVDRPENEVSHGGELIVGYIFDGEQHELGRSSDESMEDIEAMFEAKKSGRYEFYIQYTSNALTAVDRFEVEKE